MVELSFHEFEKNYRVTDKSALNPNGSGAFLCLFTDRKDSHLFIKSMCILHFLNEERSLLLCWKTIEAYGFVRKHTSGKLMHTF